MKVCREEEKILLSLGLIIILGLAVYINSLDGEFIWDDIGLIRDNLYIRSWVHTPKIFTEAIGSSVIEKSAFYRPLQVFT